MFFFIFLLKNKLKSSSVNKYFLIHAGLYCRLNGCLPPLSSAFHVFILHSVDACSATSWQYIIVALVFCCITV